MTSLKVNIMSAFDYFIPEVNANKNNLHDVTVVLKASSNAHLKLYLTDNALSKPVVVKIGSKKTRFTLDSLDLSRNRFGNTKRIPVDIMVLDSDDTWNPCSSDKLGDVQINIGTLTMNSNNLKELTKEMCLGYASVLGLNNNNIQSLPSSVFHHDQFLCQTTSLSLQGNQLKKLPIVMLRQLCRNLRTVKLQGKIFDDLNKLKSLATVPSITVQVRDNPIHCGCDILWFRTSSLRGKVADVRCASPDSVTGYTPHCFPDYTCFNRSANESSPTSNECETDRYVSMYKLYLTRIGNSLKADWAAHGPGYIYFAVSSVQEGGTVPETVLVPQDFSTTILDGLALDEFRYNICGVPRGYKAAPGTSLKCSQVDFAPKRNESNVSPQPGTSSPQNKLGLGLGVSLGLGIPAVVVIVLGVVYYRRNKSCTEDLNINYTSTDE